MESNLVASLLKVLFQGLNSPKFVGEIFPVYICLNLFFAGLL